MYPQVGVFTLVTMNISLMFKMFNTYPKVVSHYHTNLTKREPNLGNQGDNPRYMPKEL